MKTKKTKGAFRLVKRVSTKKGIFVVGKPKKTKTVRAWAWCDDENKIKEVYLDPEVAHLAHDIVSGSTTKIIPVTITYEI